MNDTLLAIGICAGIILLASSTWAADNAAGIVSNVKVLTDNVADVSSIEAWKNSYLKPGSGNATSGKATSGNATMSEEEKALAVWKSVVAHQHQNPPPREYLHSPDNVVLDPLKMFNVYGYGLCSVHASHVAALARAAGLTARNQTIVRHCVAEVQWDDEWHMLDASMVTHFRRRDGKIASIDEIIAETKAFYEKHPDLKGNPEGLEKFRTEMGWKTGPPLLASSEFFNEEGLLAANWPWQAGWPETMREFDGSTQFIFEPGYSMGYRVNVQLRAGERLTRNWFNRGLHVNMDDKSPPPCIDGTVGEGPMSYLPKYGDLANGRIGNGVHEYEVPLAGGAFRGGALRVENISSQSEDNRAPAVHVKDAGTDGTIVFRMPSSYVYLGGTLEADAVVGSGGKLVILFSENNGLDWKEIHSATRSGKLAIDLKPHVFRRYDYQLKFVLSGAGTGLDRLYIRHDIQHSQRPLPALVQGDNVIRFSADNEGTVTVEGSTQQENRGKQVLASDFHLQSENMGDPMLSVLGSSGVVTFPISTPVAMKRLRIFSFYRARDEADRWGVAASFDAGQTWREVGQLEGPHKAMGKQLEVTDIPAGTTSALVRFTGTQKTAALLFNVRLDADYDEPAGGFAPIKVTYVWEENGQEERNVHIANSPSETWPIRSEGKPTMKSIIVERE